MKSKEIIVEHVYFEESEEDIGPPPTGLTSHFSTVQDWLFDICDKDKPKKPITEYRIGLFESSNNYELFLIGVNKYAEGTNRSSIRIDFTPSNIYYALPNSEYGNMNREQILDKLITQLKAFAKTKKFKSSFLAKADVVTWMSTGEKIWSK